MKCTVCNVIVNSDEQLQQHFLGAKHKKRAATPGNLPTLNDQLTAPMSYFVKEGSAEGAVETNPSQPNPPVVPHHEGTPPFMVQKPKLDLGIHTSAYCSTCLVTLTSSSQAQMHYEGSKHKSKLRILQETTMTTAGPSRTTSKSSKTFCEICCVKITSPSEVEIHYSGSKHKQKAKLLDAITAIAETTPQTSVGHSETAENFCNTCKIGFTSESQANMHYNGSKHKNKLKLLQDVKILSKMRQSEDGQPPAKKTKFLHFCEMCNVSLTSPEVVEKHENGSKHKRRLNTIGGMGNEEASIPLFQTGRAIVKSEGGGPREASFYCSPCDVTVNSQSQMDAHTSGTKHLNKVYLMAQLEAAQASSYPNSPTNTAYSSTSHQTDTSFSSYLPPSSTMADTKPNFSQEFPRQSVY